MYILNTYGKHVNWKPFLIVLAVKEYEVLSY